MDMKTEMETTKNYESPCILKAVVFDGGVALLAGSPLVQPGGGGGGAITVETPVDDFSNDQIVGTKKSDFAFDWH